MKKLLLLAAAGVAVAAFAAGSASSTTTCVFTTSGTTMTLQNDCTTDQSINVPNGFTLDGAGHTITAVDPAAGHFVGGVIQAYGPGTANVQNVTVTASGLANVCDGGADRLRGILFDGVSGSITNTNVVNVNQGQSGCQEGNAIEVRNFGQSPTTTSVTISGNSVTNYQKNGITVNGDVVGTVTNNAVAGAGPVNYIAQNGVQYGFGSSGTARGNSVADNNYTPKDTVACGILIFQANGVSLSQTQYRDNERNLCNDGRGGGQP